jgi:hypothetical protein
VLLLINKSRKVVQMTLHLTRSSQLWTFQQLGFEVLQVFSIGQSLMVRDEMWPLCYGVVVPGLKINVIETLLLYKISLKYVFGIFS